MKQHRLAGLFAGFALALGLATAPAGAQSSSGNLSGQGVAGETIVVNGPDNGFHREIKLDKDGKFTIRRIPTGTYTVMRVPADGGEPKAQVVSVQVGSTARVM